jgi:hypothetical protein
MIFVMTGEISGMITETSAAIARIFTTSARICITTTKLYGRTGPLFETMSKTARAQIRSRRIVRRSTVNSKTFAGMKEA